MRRFALQNLSFSQEKRIVQLFLSVLGELTSLWLGCSKLMMSLFNKMLKFQSLISEICQYFLLKKCEKLLQCKSFSHIFNKKY